MKKETREALSALQAAQMISPADRRNLRVALLIIGILAAGLVAVACYPPLVTAPLEWAGDLLGRGVEATRPR